MKQDRWAEALAELKRLKDQYRSLEYTQGRMAEIGEMEGTARGKLDAMDKAKAKQIEEVRAAVREERWKDAQPRLQELVRAGHAEFQRDLDRCVLELGAEAALSEIRAAADAHQWMDAAAKLAAFEQRFKDSDAAKDNKAAIDLTRLRVGEEIVAGRTLTAAQGAADGGRWADVEKSLTQLDRVRHTDSFRGSEAAVKELRRRLYEANSKAAEDAALASWTSAQKLFGDLLAEKKYDEAADVLETFQQRHLATQFVKARTAEIDAKIADARKRKLKDRETEAANLWKSVQSEMRKQNYETAGDAIERLLRDFAELPLVKSNDRQLKTYKATCEEKGRASPNLLVEMDFEDFPGAWTPRGMATATNGDEPHQGRRCAHINLGSNGGVWHPLLGLGPRADSISFWSRTRTKGPVASLEFILHETSGMMTYSWSLTFTAQTDWKATTFRFSEFKPWNENARGLKRGIDIARVTSFQIQPDNDGSGSVPEFYFDTLRVVAAPGK
jgi:hypothetical protein